MSAELELYRSQQVEGRRLESPKGGVNEEEKIRELRIGMRGEKETRLKAENRVLDLEYEQHLMKRQLEHDEKEKGEQEGWRDDMAIKYERKSRAMAILHNLLQNIVGDGYNQLMENRTQEPGFPLSNQESGTAERGRRGGDQAGGEEFDIFFNKLVVKQDLDAFYINLGDDPLSTLSQPIYSSIGMGYISLP